MRRMEGFDTKESSDSTVSDVTFGSFRCPRMATEYPKVVGLDTADKCIPCARGTQKVGNRRPDAHVRIYGEFSDMGECLGSAKRPPKTVSSNVERGLRRDLEGVSKLSHDSSS